MGRQDGRFQHLLDKGQQNSVRRHTRAGQGLYFSVLGVQRFVNVLSPKDIPVMVFPNTIPEIGMIY